MSWRPKEWRKISEELCRQLGYQHISPYQLVDAGADAMLKAVCEEIEKGELTDDEILICRGAYIEWLQQKLGSTSLPLIDDAMIDGFPKIIANNQLQKLLNLLQDK